MVGILVLVGRFVKFPGWEGGSGIAVERRLGPPGRSSAVNRIIFIVRVTPHWLNLSGVSSWEI